MGQHGTIYYNCFIPHSLSVQGTGRGQMGQPGTIYYNCFIPHSLSVQGTWAWTDGSAWDYILQLFYTSLSLCTGYWAWTDRSAWDYSLYTTTVSYPTLSLFTGHLGMDRWVSLGLYQLGCGAAGWYSIKWNCLLSNVNTNARDKWYDFPCDYGRSYVCKI